MAFFRYDTSGPPAIATAFPAFVCGDDLTVRENVDGLSAPDTPTSATLTIKNLATDADADARVQKTITTASTSSGQITLSGGRYFLRFELTAANTALVSSTVSQVYDIQVTLSSGRIGTIRFGSIQGVAQVTQAALVPVATVTLTGSAAMDLNTSQSTTVVVRDASANVLTGRVVTYTSSNEAVAIVLSDGRVYAVGAGSVTITASSEGISGTLVITVTRATVVPPEFEWVPARDGMLARGHIGNRAIHLGARVIPAPDTGYNAGVVFQDAGYYSAGTDTWNEYNATRETTEPLFFSGGTGWETTTITSAVDPVLGGGATTNYGPGYYPGSRCRKFTHTAWDGVPSNFGLRPHIFYTMVDTAVGSAQNALGDDYQYWFLVAYRTDVVADVGKKQVIRLAGTSNATHSELRRVDPATIANRFTDYQDTEITLQHYWQEQVVGPVRFTPAERAGLTTGAFRIEIMQHSTVASQASAVILSDGWANPFFGHPDTKTGPKFAFRPQQYRDPALADPQSPGLHIPRHVTRLHSRSQNPAIVQSLYSDALDNAAWTKSGVTVSASARNVPDIRQYPAQVLQQAVWGATTSYIEQDMDHVTCDNAGANVAARSMSYKSVHVRFYARASDGSASPSLAGMTATITTLVAGVPTTTYGPTALNTIDEWGMSSTRFGFPVGETATRYRLRISNTGGAKTLQMRRVVAESGCGANEGGEHITPTLIPCRTTSHWRASSGTFWQVRDAGDLISPRTGGWLTRVYLTEDFSATANYTNTNGNGAHLLDSGPIANIQQWVGAEFGWSSATSKHFVRSRLEGDSSRSRNLNQTSDWYTDADGVQGSGVKYGVFSLSASRGVKDFGFAWSEYVTLIVRAGALTYNTGHTSATVNYGTNREWDFEIAGDTANHALYPWCDRDRRLCLCANVIAIGTWKREAPTAAHFQQAYDNWPTGS